MPDRRPGLSTAPHQQIHSRSLVFHPLHPLPSAALPSAAIRCCLWLRQSALNGQSNQPLLQIAGLRPVLVAGQTSSGVCVVVVRRRRGAAGVACSVVGWCCSITIEKTHHALNPWPNLPKPDFHVEWRRDFQTAGCSCRSLLELAGSSRGCHRPVDQAQADAPVTAVGC